MSSGVGEAAAASGPEGVATRRLALEVLARIEDDGAYANLALGPALSGSGLAERDRGLVTDLVYGTVRRRRALDHRLDPFLDTTPPPSARRALRLGAYQLAHRADIPAYAAVSATVGASPKRYRPLVNAVLRRLADAVAEDPEWPDLATELSYPDWIVERLREDLGADRAVIALEAMNEPARVHVRADGYVQDVASQAVAAALLESIDLDRPPGRSGPGAPLVVDLCAAPGGKATAIASAGAEVVAADRSETRLGLVVDNARRLGLAGVAPVLADALHPPLRPGCADAVLLDAPCSGLGVLRRRADARWRVDADAPERLAKLQRAMADAAAMLVRPGGVLVYSVCTLTAVESIGVDDHLRLTRPELQPLDPPPGPWEPWGRGALLLPAAGPGGSDTTDGMVLLRYRRPVPGTAAGAGGGRS